MSSQTSFLVQAAARLLGGEDREAVLGDLEEAHEGTWESLFGILGLLVRRQALLWKDWRPWFAGFGVALPCSFLLMGASLSVSWSYQRLLCPELLKAASLTRGSGLFVLFYEAVLLGVWSWTGGFVVGSLSRRTLWVSTLLCYGPCLFCLSRFRMDSVPRICLLLFLLPAVWGVHQGMRLIRVNLVSAVTLAVTVTAFTMIALDRSAEHWSNVSLWNLNWLLSMPAWYLVAAARKTAHAALPD